MNEAAYQIIGNSSVCSRYANCQQRKHNRINVENDFMTLLWWYVPPLGVNLHSSYIYNHLSNTCYNAWPLLVSILQPSMAYSHPITREIMNKLDEHVEYTYAHCTHVCNCDFKFWSFQTGWLIRTCLQHVFTRVQRSSKLAFPSTNKWAR